MALQTLDQRKDDMHAACDALSRAVDKGSLGNFVKQNNRLIMEYYQDVLDHIRKSFKIALLSAIGGFVIFFLTLVYVLGLDLWLTLKHPDALKVVSDGKLPSLRTVALLGAISGFIVQFFAGVAFYLYQRVAEQFSAFHICLERTHRYLVAYKMVEEIKVNKDEAIHDLVCIMAEAPAITRADITDKKEKKQTEQLHQLVLPIKEQVASVADKPTLRGWTDTTGMSNGCRDEH